MIFIVNLHVFEALFLVNSTGKAYKTTRTRLISSHFAGPISQWLLHRLFHRYVSLQKTKRNEKTFNAKLENQFFFNFSLRLRLILVSFWE